MENRKEVEKKKYEVELIIYDDGTFNISRLNTGFNAYELLGILEGIQLDTIDQMKIKEKPTEIIHKRVINKS